MASKKSSELSLAGRSVTVFGLGRFGGGVAAVKFLAAQGARVTVADEASESTLAGSVAKLAGTPVSRWVFEAPPVCPEETEVLVVNPAIPPDHAVLSHAAETGCRVTSEMELFLSRNRARLVAVTGSNGKSTTAALIAEVLGGCGTTCWLGGNIGRSLLTKLENIESDHVVVLELSSFQLSRLPSGVLKPDVAVVTNCTPNHLDWHADLTEYQRAKRRVFAELGLGGTVVLSAVDPVVSSWTPAAGRVLRFGVNAADVGADGVCCADDTVTFLRGGVARAVPAPVGLAGPHNRLNTAAALAAAWAMGAVPDDAVRASCEFSGLPYRLQSGGEFDGRAFVNDANATTPESTIAAIEAADGPIVLICGGADKGIDWTPLAHRIAEKVRAVHLIGATAAAIDQWFAAHCRRMSRATHPSLDAAFQAAVDESRQGDIVMFSPGFASFGLYTNYEERGRHFDRLVLELSENKSGVVR